MSDQPSDPVREQVEQILSARCSSAQFGECDRQRGEKCAACDDVQRTLLTTFALAQRQEQQKQDAHVCRSIIGLNRQLGIKDIVDNHDDLDGCGVASSETGNRTGGEAVRKDTVRPNTQ